MLVNELSKHTLLARQLKRLVFATCFWWRLPKPNHVKALLKMLQANRRLEYVMVEVSGECYDAYIAEAKKCHNVPLPIAKQPFPLECRLAFLSIFRSDHHRRGTEERESKRARSELASTSTLTQLAVDRHVLGIIFAFVAECVRRRVHLKPNRERQRRAA